MSDFDCDFDSYSYGDFSYDYDPEYSEPIIENVPQYEKHQSQSHEIIDNNYKIADNDPSIVFSSSIDQTRSFIRKNLNLSVSSLRSTHAPGLVILRLEDFALIRNDSRCSRIIKQILYIPTPGSQERHPDLHTALNVLNKN